MSPRPKLEQWHADRLKYPVVLLDGQMRNVAESAIREICGFRDWMLLGVSVRSNHVHVVVSASSHHPDLVRDQLKAKATTELRKSSTVWKDRPVWTKNGDIEFLDTENDIENCVIYVSEAQDRMGLEK